MTDNQIREIFLANGFTIKDGQTDLKPYVYAAARALLAAASPPPAQTADVREMADEQREAILMAIGWHEHGSSVRDMKYADALRAFLLTERLDHIDEAGYAHFKVTK
jgi:hypothetical protein